MQPSSEKKPCRRRLWLTFFSWALVAAGISLCVYVYFHNPFEERVTVCVFHALTGLDCPGCGMTRAAYLLLHGHPVSALRQNPFILVVLAAGYMLLAELSPYLIGRQLPRLSLPDWVLILVFVLLLLYNVGRNVVKFI